jgi:hypothetical protein
MHKQSFKQHYHKCAICDIDEYNLLDVHRINEGKEYSLQNCVCLCCNCHRKHHSGLIKIISKIFSTSGYVLNYVDEQGKDVIKLL